jgi:hypothetical protein
MQTVNNSAITVFCNPSAYYMTAEHECMCDLQVLGRQVGYPPGAGFLGAGAFRALAGALRLLAPAVLPAAEPAGAAADVAPGRTLSWQCCGTGSGAAAAQGRAQGRLGFCAWRSWMQICAAHACPPCAQRHACMHHGHACWLGIITKALMPTQQDSAAPGAE